MALGWPSWFISGSSATAAYAEIPTKVFATSSANSTGMIGNWMMGVTANTANKDLSFKYAIGVLAAGCASALLTYFICASLQSAGGFYLSRRLDSH